MPADRGEQVSPRQGEPVRSTPEQSDVAQASFSLPPGGTAGTSPDPADVAQVLGSVLLEEWGGPRSPLALSYIQDVIIPDLVHCLVRNADLWQNPTFAEIVAWKFKSQYAFPQAVAGSLTSDLLTAVLRMGRPAQNNNRWEPWRRILRANVAGKSLLDVEKEEGYPLAYSNLLLLRLSKLRKYLGQSGAGYRDCLEHPELRECGPEQLRFLYKFQEAMTTEPLYREKLILEQVSVDLGGSLPVSALADLLKTVQAGEERADEAALISVLISVPEERIGVVYETEYGAGNAPGRDRLSAVIAGLIKLELLERCPSGGLRLTDTGAAVIAPFLIPELLEQLHAVRGNREEARRMLLRLNPGVLLPLLREVRRGFPEDIVWGVFEAVYQESDRRIDLFVIESAAEYERAAALLLKALQAEDSLVRAQACRGLGRWTVLRKRGQKMRTPEAEEKWSSGKGGGMPKKPEIVLALVRTLADPVAQVREEAAQALGNIGSPEGLQALAKVAEDFYESPNVRGRAREALRRIVN